MLKPYVPWPQLKAPNQTYILEDKNYDAPICVSYENEDQPGERGYRTYACELEDMEHLAKFSGPLHKKQSITL